MTSGNNHHLNVVRMPVKAEVGQIMLVGAVHLLFFLSNSYNFRLSGNMEAT